MIDYSGFERAIGLNWYEVDPDVQDIVKRYVPAEDFEAADARLREVGALIGGPVAERAEMTDRIPPKLERFDRWGREVNRVVHHPGALQTKRDLWESGRRHGADNGRAHPVVGSVSGYLLDQAETGMSCAIGMTGGVAGLVASYGSDEVKAHFMPHFTTDNYDDFWDGAMFLTERDGGSDLGSSTKTIATHVDGDLWVLNGFKWFCSNVDAQAIATLARPEGGPDGIGGIALFVVPRKRRDGTPNGVHVNRIKEKLGTRAVPTGEVDFADAEAYLLAGGERSREAATDGKGMGRMMGGMVQGSRLGVAFMGLGIARRSFLEAAIYASHRRAFGNTIGAFPMVQETLVRMAMELEAAAALSFDASSQSGRDPALWRILPTLAKYRATRRGVQLASAAIEVHGGNGYIEDWPVARQLRDGQCHPIWEGTENIIAIDVMRSIERENVLPNVMERVSKALGGADSIPVLASTSATVAQYAKEVQEAVNYVAGASKDVSRLHPRRITRYLANLVSAALLVEQASWELESKGSARKAAVARLYANVHLAGHSLGGIGRDDQIILGCAQEITAYGEVDPDRLLSLVA